MKRWSDRVPARTRRIGLASMALTSECWGRLVTAAPRDALHVRDRSHRQEIVPECRTINVHHSGRLTGHRQDDDRPRLGVRRRVYSYLIATSGSTRAARRAGRKAATNAAPTKTAIEVTLVTGSCAVTPNCSCHLCKGPGSVDLKCCRIDADAALEIGGVHRWRRRLPQALVHRVPDNADDLHVLRRTDDGYPLPERRDVLQVLPNECLIDDRNGRSRRVVSVREVAPEHKRCTEHFEIPRSNDVEVHFATNVATYRLAVDGNGHADATSH